MTQFGIATKTLDEISDGERVYNADRTRVAAFWVGRTRADRWDDDTIYEIAEWDVASRNRVESYTRVHKCSLSDGTETGKPVVSLHYGDDGALQIGFRDGSSEPAREERVGVSPRKGPKLDFSGLKDLP